MTEEIFQIQKHLFQQISNTNEKEKKNFLRIVKPLRCQNNEMLKLNKSSLIFVLTTCTRRATSI